MTMDNGLSDDGEDGVGRPLAEEEGIAASPGWDGAAAVDHCW